MSKQYSAKRSSRLVVTTYTRIRIVCATAIQKVRRQPPALLIDGGKSPVTPPNYPVDPTPNPVRPPVVNPEEEETKCPSRLWTYLGFGLAFMGLCIIIWLLWPRPYVDLTIEVNSHLTTTEYNCQTEPLTASTASLTVSNTGNRAVGPFYIMVDGQELLIEGLAAGGQETIAAPAALGRQLVVVADNRGEIRERNENNNEDEVTVSAETTLLAALACKPDITVALGWECDSNDQIAVWADVSNNGFRDVDAFSILINGEARSVDGLTVGEKAQFKALIPDSNGQITIMADEQAAIDELSEANNEVTAQLARVQCEEAPPQPDLTVSLAADCTAPEWVSGYAFVTNVGNGAANDFEVSLNGEFLAELSLPAGASKLIPFSQAALTEFVVIVDATNQINEASEENNLQQLTVDLTVAECQFVEESELDVQISVAVQCDQAIYALIATATVENLAAESIEQLFVSFGAGVMEFSIGANESQQLTYQVAEETVITAQLLTSDSNPENNLATFEISEALRATCAPAEESEEEVDLVISQACKYNDATGLIDYTVVARNDGPDEAGSFVVDVNGRRFRRNGLAAGHEVRFDMTFPAGTANFVARVDRFNEVEESNERNNRTIMYINQIAETPCQPETPSACTRFDFEIGREAITGLPQEGTLRIIEVGTDREIGSWYARAGELDSDWMYNLQLSNKQVHVYVTFTPAGSTQTIELEIINHAPNVRWGWLANGSCHALELQFPISS